MIVIVNQANKAGVPKTLSTQALPLTGRACVDLIITDLCVLECDRPGLRLVELAPGVGLDEVRAKTGAVFAVAGMLQAAA